MANNEIDVPLHFDSQTLRLVSRNQLKSMTVMIAAEQRRRIARDNVVIHLEKLNAVYDKKMSFDVDNAIVRVRGALESHADNRRLKREAAIALSRLRDLAFSNVTCKAGTVKWDNVVTNAWIRESRESPFYGISVAYGPGTSTPAGRGDVFGSGDLTWTITAGTDSSSMEVEVFNGGRAILKVERGVLICCPGVFEAMRRFVVAKFNPSEFIIPTTSGPSAYVGNAAAAAVDSRNNLWINGEA
jgi:hypothetical protein